MTSVLESDFADVSLESENITPGLFELSLNLLYQPDIELLKERQKLLEIFLEEEHSTVRHVLQNLIALIKYRLPRRQNDAREILENILDEHPKHLNTLANLEKIYRRQHREKDANDCKDRKNDILKSQDPENIELRAQCLLEQGYAFLIDEPGDNEGPAMQELEDAYSLLTIQYNKSKEGNRKQFLRKALISAKEANSHVLSALGCTTEDTFIQLKKSSTDMFEQGIKLLDSLSKTNEDEYGVWQFYLGKAYNRLDYSCYRYQMSDEIDRGAGRMERCKNIAECFWKTITRFANKSKFNLYIGRSYAYLGQLVSIKGDLVCDSMKDSCFDNPDFKDLLANKDRFFKLAYEKSPNDVHVMNRHARFLFNTSDRRSLAFEDTLKQSEKILTTSVTILQENNWFAYNLRMQTRLSLGHLIANEKHRMDEARDWFEKAREDGIKCFHSKGAAAEICKLAKICQILAKFPVFRKYGPRYVQNIKRIHEAITYLNHALLVGGYWIYDVNYILGLCLYEIKEYRPAIEWMKRAMALPLNPADSQCLTCICQYLLTLYANSERSSFKNNLTDDVSTTYVKQMGDDFSLEGNPDDVSTTYVKQTGDDSSLEGNPDDVSTTYVKQTGDHSSLEGNPDDVSTTYVKQTGDHSSLEGNPDDVSTTYVKQTGDDSSLEVNPDDVSTTYVKQTGDDSSLEGNHQKYVTLYSRENKHEEVFNPGDYLIEELTTVLREEKNRLNGITAIKGTIEKIYKFNKRELILWLKYLLRTDNLDKTIDKHLISDCIVQLEYECKQKRLTSINKTLLKKITLIVDKLTDVASDQSDHSCRELFSRPSIVVPSSNDAMVPFNNEYTYDFFISYSNADREWVHGVLLSQLEIKLDFTDTAFKGCVAERDFTPGVRILDNIINAIENSFKVLFVLTPDFKNSLWCEYEVDHALVEVLNKDKNFEKLVPILRKDEECIPKKLKAFTYLDMRENSKRIDGILRLKRTLSKVK